MTKTGIIIAGGKSSRIGQNKALLKLNSKTVIEIILNKIKPVFDEVIIISNNPDDYSFLELIVYKDIYPGLGPLAGIHSGLTNSNSEINFIISCDLPLITTEAIDFIANYNSKKSAIMYKKDDRLQYLCAVYKQDCLPIVEQCLKTGRLKVKDFINKIDIEIVDAAWITEEIFFNLNTVEDFNYLKNLNN